MQSPGFQGAVGLRVTARGIADAGSVSHGAGVIRRTLVVDGTLYTVSEAGIKASTLATLAERGWAAFPATKP